MTTLLTAQDIQKYKSYIIKMNKKINEIASNYVNSLGEVLPGYTFGYINFNEFIGKYYFDFVFKKIDKKFVDNPPVAGGACGFTIDKVTFEIEQISHSELQELNNLEMKINDVYAKIKNIKNNNTSLNWLKFTYDLTSTELLEIKKMIQKTDFEKKNILEKLNSIINNKL